MKIIISIIILIFLQIVVTNQKLFLCGDHICINKSEAEQYFEENLTIEVKIVGKKIKEELDLVQLNLLENTKNKRNVSIFSKNNSNKKLKLLLTEISKLKKN